VSPKGAKGLMQLMPEDCVAYNVSDPFDPRQNLAAGTKQLADKLREQGGNLELALAAYNAGSGAVRHYKGVPPYTETLNYIRRVKALMGR
jgi:soluble lytic murein transglycosylase-like protein